MRTLILASFASLAMSIAAFGPGESTPAPDLAIPGLPATDHTWSTQEFEAAAGVLEAVPAGRLPHDSGPGAGAMFDRLTDPAAMAPCGNDAPLSARMDECLRLLNAFGRVLRLYVITQQSDLSYSDEAIRLMGFTLRSGAAMSDVVDDYVPTLDRSDPTYPIRMQGFERVRFGTIQVVQGALTSLTTDRRVYSDASAAAFAAILAETYPTLSRNFPPDTKARFAQTLASIARDDPSADVRAALSAYDGVD